MSMLIRFPGDHQSWDDFARSLKHANIFASHAWSTVQERSGWTTHRFVDTNHSYGVQFFSKQISRLCTVGWIPGGVLGTRFKLDNEFALGFRQFFRSWSSYLRVSFPYALDVSVSADDSWRLATSPLGAKQSVIIDLRRSPEDLIRAMGPNWRRNLKRSQRTEFEVRQLGNADLDAVDILEEGTARLKKLRLDSAQRASDVIRLLGESAVVIGVFDSSGQLVSVRGASVFATEARDLISATSVEGRRAYASYRATWDLITLLHQRHLQHFDLAGIDPKGNPGVADFKRGTGGADVLYGGEFSHSHPSVLRYPIEAVLKARSA